MRMTIAMASRFGFKREDTRSVKQLGQSNGDVGVNLQGLDALTKVAERSRKLVDLYAERITVTLVWQYRAGTNHSD